jgi:hypothetical protein
MAGNEDRKAELIAQLARARQQIDSSSSQVRRALDVPARVRGSFQKHAVLWIGGAVITGVVIAKFARRPRAGLSARKKGGDAAVKKAGAAGLLLAGAKIAFDAFRPMLAKWLVSRATPYVEKMMTRYASHTHTEQDRRTRGPD